MKTIIAGGRSVTDFSQVKDAMRKCGWTPSRILSGGAKGADKLGEQWAATKGIPIDYYPAKWARYGRDAGALRNNEMAKHADALVAIWDGKSPGTRDMITRAQERKLKLYVHFITEKK